MTTSPQEAAVTESDKVFDPASVWSRHGDDTVVFFGQTARQTRRAWVLPSGRQEAHYPAMDFLGYMVETHQTPYDHLAISVNTLCELYFDSAGAIMNGASCFEDRIELVLVLQGIPHRVVAYAAGLPDNVDVIFCDNAGNYLPHDTSPVVVMDPGTLSSKAK